MKAQGRTNLHTLSRVAWDGRERSLRMMRYPFRDYLCAGQANAERSDLNPIRP